MTSRKKYVILLRGVNVGGKNRLPNMELKRILEELGFKDVATYINSGNAVFSSDETPRADIVRGELEKNFDFPIPVIILPAAKVINIAASIPKNWTNDAPNIDKHGQKSDVLYLFDEIDDLSTLERIAFNREIEQMIYVNGALLLNISRKNQHKSCLLKIVGTPLYRQMTIRNIKTAKKLAELVSDH